MIYRKSARVGYGLKSPAILYNPVKHGFVLIPFQWKYSSIHPYIKKGLLSKEWVCNEGFKPLGFGA